MTQMSPHHAARDGNPATIRPPLAQAAPVDGRNAMRATPLPVATRADAVSAAAALIATGADVRAGDRIQDSPCPCAGARDHAEILRRTLNHGADLHRTDRFGGTAPIGGHVNIVSPPIAAGVAVDHVNNLGRTALFEAIISDDGGPRQRQVVEDLPEAGADPDPDPDLADGDGVSPLQHARQGGYRQIESLLLSFGAGSR